MTIRLEVQPDCRIELLRVSEGRTLQPIYFGSLRRCLLVVGYLLKRDQRKARKERFVPELDRECDALLKTTLKEKANGKKEAAGPSGNRGRVSGD